MSWQMWGNPVLYFSSLSFVAYLLRSYPVIDRGTLRHKSFTCTYIDQANPSLKSKHGCHYSYIHDFSEDVTLIYCAANFTEFHQCIQIPINNNSGGTIGRDYYLYAPLGRDGQMKWVWPFSRYCTLVYFELYPSLLPTYRFFSPSRLPNSNNRLMYSALLA